MRCLVLFLTILTMVSSAGAQAKFLCTKMNGEKVKATACEPFVKPTASPAPPPTVQCSSDRTFRAGVSGIKPGDLALVGKIYPYDQKVDLCATLPAQSKIALLLSATNHSNAQCNVYDVWMISPSGKYYNSRSPQPGTSAPYEAGQWTLTVYLDSTQAACAANHALDLFLSPL